MFQYAAGRALSLHLQVPHKLYTHSYFGYPMRKYELEEYFDMRPGIATAEDMQAFTLAHPVRRAWNKIVPANRLKGLPYSERKTARLVYEIFYLVSPPHTRNVYEERQAHFDKNFFKATSPVFLKGYWMSYKYFEKYSEIIKKDFTIRPELVAHLSALQQEMQTRESIGVHVRCTDRKTPENLKLYGEIPATYFEKAIAYIQKKKKKEVHLYVFSDDEVMAKKYIPQHLPATFISNKITKDPIEDFYLMTQCKNLVMTNSTFSWWAAYLTKSAEPLIITPARWYNEAHYNYQDIYCPSWIKVEN